MMIYPENSMMDLRSLLQMIYRALCFLYKTASMASLLKQQKRYYRQNSIWSIIVAGAYAEISLKQNDV